MSAMLSPALTADRPGRATITQLCHACGVTDQAAPATCFVYRRGASFCFPCWQRRPGSAQRPVLQASGLRGVSLP